MSNFKSTKLIAGYIKRLTKDDMDKLELLLSSKYFNTNKKLVPFFKYIKKHYPDFDKKNFTESNCYKALSPDKNRAFHKGNFDGYKAQLIKKIIDYMAFEELKNNEQLKKNLNNSAFSKRDFYSSFKKKSLELIDELDKKKDKSIPDYQLLLNIYHDIYFHIETEKDDPLNDNYIVSAMENLDIFYAFSKLSYANELLTKNSFQQKKYEIRLLEEAINIGKKTELKNNELFQLLVYSYNFLKSKKTKTYHSLKEFLFKQKDLLDDNGKKATIIILMNFAYSELNKGKFEFQKELFELQVFREEENLFLIYQVISDESFINAIVTASASEEFEWANFFKKKYLPFIPTDKQASAINLSNAYIHFFKNEIDEAIDFLNQVDKKNLNINLRHRTLLIRCFYELSLNDYAFNELTLSNIENLLAFLNKRNLSDAKNASFTNFCKICKSLLAKKAKSTILKSLNTMDYVLSKAWLLKKINELKK